MFFFFFFFRAGKNIICARRGARSSLLRCSPFCISVEKRHTMPLKATKKKKKETRYAPPPSPARVVFFPTARLERRCGAGRGGPKVEAVQGFLSGIEVALRCCGLRGGSRCSSRGRGRCSRCGCCGVVAIATRSVVCLHHFLASSQSRETRIECVGALAHFFSSLSLSHH